jgi:HD-GYP domain-containing protein (c-di-GMP phosphodiesterase class II)
VADAYDAMTTDRVYRSRLSHERAMAELERCAGTQFDPEVVAAFVEEFEEPRRLELVVLESA